MGVGHTEWWEGFIGKGTARAKGQRREAYELIGRQHTQLGLAQSKGNCVRYWPDTCGREVGSACPGRRSILSLTLFRVAGPSSQ